MIWGDDGPGTPTDPASLTNVAAVSAGGGHSLALLTDGSVAAWGSNNANQSTVPGTAVDVIAVAAGGRHSLALKADGSLVAWGDDTFNQTNIPAPAASRSPPHRLSLAKPAAGSSTRW